MGKVKTRLAKDVGNEAALEIYKFLLEHTASITKELSAEKEVWYSEEINLNDLWNSKFFSKKLQQGKDLGERMKNAFEEGFKQGFSKVIVIGSDMYDLASEDIEKAFEHLDQHDFVVGPAEDGGYYLLGMKKLNYMIFRNKNWGTDSVLRETMKNIETQKVYLLEERNDIDTYEDIKEVKALQNLLY